MLNIAVRNKAFLNWITECNQFAAEDFTPFVIDNMILGYIHKEKILNFIQYDTTFSTVTFQNQTGQQQDAITFHQDISDRDERTQAANAVAKQWYEKGILRSWVGEQYHVNTGFNQTSFFTIERAAASLFGIKKYGVHVNAWVEKQGEVFIWVARRANDKPTFPGKLDHLVAGGHGVGYRIEETLIKECAEEANIPEKVAQQAKPVSMVSYLMDNKQKLQYDNLFIYDLKLEENFVPENTDGEAEEFFLWPVEKVMEVVATTRDYKTNCNLVIIDFAVRHGFLKPDEPFYSEICSGLHR